MLFSVYTFYSQESGRAKLQYPDNFSHNDNVKEKVPFVMQTKWVLASSAVPCSSVHCFEAHLGWGFSPQMVASLLRLLRDTLSLWPRPESGTHRREWEEGQAESVEGSAMRG